jgi:cell fate regulator YaaT (PSP1 superfamily)
MTPETTEPSAEKSASLVKVQFHPAGALYDYDAGNLPLKRGDFVIVQTSRGTTLGTIASEPRAVSSRQTQKGTPRIIKRADERAVSRHESNLERARKAQQICAHRIRERNMPMRLITSESTFDGSKITFYFFAEKRVDFRELVRDLNQTLHTRIEMKHIGNRDETKMIGGVGPCGRELCCSSWLREFSSVSVRMAKEQGLSLKPSKLAGMCGRLKCCLRYEYETYRELGRALPNVGKCVESVKGKGVVLRQNRLKQSVVLRLEDDGIEVEVLLDDLVEKRADT